MNERIEELAEQAGAKFPFGGFVNYDQFDYEKFAKLIVRECMDVALDKKKWVEDQVVFDPRDQAWNKARGQQSQHIVDKIQEHFGIEE